MNARFGILFVLVALCVVGIVFAHVKFSGQEDAIRGLTEEIRKIGARAEPPVVQRITEKETYDDTLLSQRMAKQEERMMKEIATLREELGRKTPSAGPAEKPATSENKELEQIVRDVIKKREEEKEAASDADWDKRVKTEGIALVGRGVPDLTEEQKALIAPLMEKYAATVQPVWWPGVDAEGKSIPFDEKVKRSDEIRAGIYKEIKQYLSAHQVQKFDQWIADRKARIDKNESVDGWGPFRWF